MAGGDKKGGSTVPSENTLLANPIVYYKQRTGKYPNNTQQWWSMKRPPEMGTDRPPKQYLEVFDPGLRYQISSGNSPAAKGHYILDAFQQDRSAVANIPGLPVVSSNGHRPTAVAFYAGRVFYSGVFTSNFNTKVYFSQIIERPEQVNFCYQEGDPTSEEIRDLLPSDGGVLVIPEVVQIFHMVAYDIDLYVFSSNGVWRISGSQGVGFRANDFSVSKLSGAPTISNLSFVDVEGVPVWWNRSGINTLAPSEQGQLQVTSLTDTSIKSLYDEIPEQSKFYAKGTYDSLLKRVQFLYRSTETDIEAELFTYDRILVLDVRTGAWMPWDLPPEARVDVKGLFTLEGKSVSQELLRVVVGTDEVVAGTQDVYSFVELRKIVQAKVKYIINVKDEGVLPPPLPPEPVAAIDVYVNDNRVAVNTDLVILQP